MDLVPIHRTILDGVCPNTNLYHFSTQTWENREAGEPIELEPHQMYATGTFANSLFLDQYRRYTSIKKIYLRVVAEGEFQIRVLVKKLDFHFEVIHRENVVIDEQDGPREILIELPPMDWYKPFSRMFYEIRTNEATATLHKIEYVVANEKNRKPANVLVLIRTFNRRADVLHLAKRLTSEVDLAQDNFFYLFLDASAPAQQIDEDDLRKVMAGTRHVLLRGPNLGSAGNISNAVIQFEKLNTGFAPDEVLILDDDIEIDAESVRRYAAFSQFRTQDVVISGAILSKKDPTQVFQLGAFYGRSPYSVADGKTQEAYHLGAVNHCLEVGRDTNCFNNNDYLAASDKCDFANFVFFGFPYSQIAKVGLPVPFFLKVDDCEYSLRLGRNNCPVIAFPGCYAWHEPYWICHTIVHERLTLMHMLANDCKYTNVGRRDILKNLHDRVKSHLSYFDYFGANIYLNAVRDFVNLNPGMLTEQFMDFYPKFMSSVNQEYAKTQTELGHDYVNPLYVRDAALPPPGKWYNGMMGLTLFGHLIPSFMRSGVFVAGHVFPPKPHSLFKRSTILFNQGSGLIRMCEPRVSKCLGTLAKTVYLSAKVIVSFGRVKREWNRRMEETRTIDFWKKIDAKTSTQVVINESQRQLNAGETDCISRAA